MLMDFIKKYVNIIFCIILLGFELLQYFCFFYFYYYFFVYHIISSILLFLCFEIIVVVVAGVWVWALYMSSVYYSWGVG